MTDNVEVTVDIDDSVDNQDWTKQSWDLSTDWSGFLADIRTFGATPKDAFLNFMKLPAGQAIPRNLFELAVKEFGIGNE